ncbi:MAG TPA: PAS domain-containing protein [Allosphingosinicella sp.]|jgi:PAS domain S-box-containing protein
MASSEPPGSPAGPETLSFLANGGEMGERMRSYDWSCSPLGPPKSWPQPLKTAVGIVLSTKFPMFLVWGPDLRFLYNDAYVEILGDKHPFALGFAFEDIWADVWDQIQPIVERAMAGEGSFYENHRLTLTRRGFVEDAWFTFSYTPLGNEAGGVGGILCTVVETTATVLAERERLGETERLRQLFDNAPGFMAVVRGPDHVFEMANASYQTLVGRTDLIGKPVRQAVPEVEGQGLFEALDKVYRSGEPFSGRSVAVRLQRSPGGPREERLLDFVFQPIFDSSGAVNGIFADGYDVTERIVAETALRESEERFRLIADLAPVPMWVTKLDRKRSFVNRAYVEFLGISYEEAVDFDWRTVIHPDDSSRVVAESIAGEASFETFELVARYCSRGEWRWIRSVSQPRWGPQGEHCGFIGVAHDITELKRAESALREVNETLERRVSERTADLSAALDRLQSEVGERLKAEEALRQAQKMEAVGQLTGGIAHDFNNLLTPIMGGLEMIASRVEDARLKRIAETALESTRRGAKLTGQLLAFSRIQRISMAPIAVNSVIEAMQRLLRHTIGGEVRIDTRLDPGAGHGICDANQLENAILNLAINARDAMPEGGALTICTDRVSLDEAPDHPAGEFVRITVADTGSGMPPDVLARATEPFYSTKPLGKGTGLGLAQVYGIAQQAGGTLRIDSEEGKGTFVHILLPAAEVPEQAEAELAGRSGPAPQGAAAGKTLLVVDDDSDVRGFLAESLEGLGCTVVSAASGTEGLEAMRGWRPDLVLMDYAMPGMNGAEAARAARELHPGLPIVFVTGYAESEQLESALGGDVPVLRKPFTLDQLASAVEENVGT